MIHEEAFKKWVEGVKYKEIAKECNVSVNTVKSWYKRYSWKEKKAELEREGASEEVCLAPETTDLIPGTNNLRSLIEDDLKRQLAENRTTHAHYMDLVDDYLSLWDIKNLLIADIQERGVVVMGATAEKKNDSISELNKTNAQMLKLLSELGLKATEIEKEDHTSDDV